MRSDIYGQQIFTELDLCSLYLQDPKRTIKNMLVETQIQFNNTLQLESLPKLIPYKSSELTVEEFDEVAQQTWYIPKQYVDMDIAKWVLDQCKTEAELQRAGAELIKFQERDLFILLKYLKYLVDTMRSNKIVWGVGRGSSVASFCLFLIGIHKINPLLYNLDHREFLR